MESPVQRSDPGERHPALGALHEEAPHHLQAVGHARLHDRVVDVADDHEAGAGRRDEHLAGIAYPGSLGRHLQLHLVPEPVPLRHVVGRQIEMEVAVAIGLHPGGAAGEPGGHLRAPEPPAHEAPKGVCQLPAQAARGQPLPEAWLVENPPHEVHLVAGAVAPIGLDHHAFQPPVAPHGPGHDAQNPPKSAVHGAEHTGQPMPQRRNRRLLVVGGLPLHTLFVA